MILRYSNHQVLSGFVVYTEYEATRVHHMTSRLNFFSKLVRRFENKLYVWKPSRLHQPVLNYNTQHPRSTARCPLNLHLVENRRSCTCNIHLLSYYSSKVTKSFTANHLLGKLNPGSLNRYPCKQRY